MFAVCLAGNHIKGFSRAHFSSSSHLIICVDGCSVFICAGAKQKTTCWVCYVTSTCMSLYAAEPFYREFYFRFSLPGADCKPYSWGVFIVSLCVLIWCYVPLDLGKLVSMGTDSNSRWCVLECVPCGHNLCVRIPVFSFLFPAFSTQM